MTYYPHFKSESEYQKWLVNKFRLLSYNVQVFHDGISTGIPDMMVGRIASDGDHGAIWIENKFQRNGHFEIRPRQINWIGEWSPVLNVWVWLWTGSSIRAIPAHRVVDAGAGKLPAALFKDCQLFDAGNVESMFLCCM